MSNSSPYIDPKTVNESYRPRRGLMSPGLKRAREPYRIRNALTGFGLGLLAVGIWAYSISAVRQDVFDDLDEEAKALGLGTNAASGSNSGSTSVSSTGVGAGVGVGSGSAVSTLTEGNGNTRKAAVEEKTAGGKIASDAEEKIVVLEGLEGLLPAVTPLHLLERPQQQRRGVLQALDGRFPRLLDPQRKTLVWGAPPVDTLGRLGDRI